MRNHKNNITSSVKNITLNLQNITPHFTGKAKIITLVLIIIMLSFVNITLCFPNIFSNSNVSALSYQSNVGVSFTFNPTLSVNISPSNLTIDNLTPGTNNDSNVINVSVATNASYGYTLSATVGDSTHDNSNLTHSNNTNVFSSIAIDSNLPSLTTDNTWGYNISLDSGSTWSNYNGLSSSSSTTLLDKDSNISSSIDFRIGAKASPVQPSGTYTNTITFTAVTKPTPMNLSESYFAHGKTRHNGYYAMQDMTSEICNDTEIIGEGSQTELIDLRDNKVYWATKLADNHCWMTQNLDLDLSPDRPLTSEDTDLNDITSVAYQDGYRIDGDNIYWAPASTANTINFENTSIDDWQNGNSIPYSANKTDDTNIGHSSLGNYYNWTAAIASNNSGLLDEGGLNNISKNPKNSICPKGWRLPIISNQAATDTNSSNEFSRLNYLYNNSSTENITKLLSPPLYFTLSGGIFYNKSENLSEKDMTGFYWSSSYYKGINSNAFDFLMQNNRISVYDNSQKNRGFSVRCLTR